MTGEEREALDAVISLLRSAGVLTRLGRGLPGELSGHVLTVGIDIAVDDAVQLLLPDRVTLQPPSCDDDPVALLRAAQQLLTQVSSVDGGRVLEELCDEVSELLAEAESHAAG